MSILFDHNISKRNKRYPKTYTERKKTYTNNMLQFNPRKARKIIQTLRERKFLDLLPIFEIFFFINNFRIKGGVLDK